MTLEELREFKSNLLDKYVNSGKNKDVRYMMRKIDKLIAKKLKG